MSLTLGLTGMDPATEAALKAAFIEANARLGERWSLVPDGEAGHVIVDMDSMYGPMSWLRLHASGRRVIGLSSAPRTQTDYRLGRPFDTVQLMALLAQVARAEGVELQSAADAPAAGSDPEPAMAEPAPAPAVAEPTPTPAPATTAPAPPPAVEGLADVAPATAPPADAGAESKPTPAADPVPAAVAAAAPAENTLASWLQPGALSGHVRYRRDAGPSLLIDASTDTWFGPAQLKPIAAYFEGTVSRSDFDPVEDADWAQETATAGAAQPLSRLRWLGGLLAGGGALLPGTDPEDRFQLHKWPQTEREYPRHFRIATHMMKGPATVAEIARGSGVPEPDVINFVNANLATGFAAPVVDAPPPVEEPAKPRGGLLGRLRNR